MKPYLLLLGLLTMGCARYLSPPTTHDRLANLPTEPHERDIAVLFPNDPLPTEPYINVGVLEAHGGQYTPYNELVRALQANAQSLGVDAIQLLGKDYIADTEGIEVIDTYVTSTLSGLGLLYLKNAAYLTQYVQAKEVYRYNDTTGRYDTWVGGLELAYDGTDPKVMGSRFYAGFANRYDLEHLRYEETSDWWYTTDSRGRIARRGYRPSGTLIKTCKFTYNEQGQVTEVQIRYPSVQKSKETVQLHYGEAGQVLEQRIEREDRPPLREVPAYDEQGQRVGSEFLIARRNEPFKPYLRVVYQFFDLTQLPVHGSVVKSIP